MAKEEVKKNTPQASGFYWLKNVGNDDYTPVTVVNDGEELMVCQISRTSTLSLGHFPEERWGLEITPPAM